MDIAQRDTVLIIDDQSLATQRLVKDLQVAGFEVLTATDGATAIAQAPDRCPDIYLLAAGSSPEESFATCRQLKTSILTHDIPIILMVGVDDPIDKAAGLDIGIADYAAIPIHLPELINRIQLHLKLRKLNSELALSDRLLKREMSIHAVVEDSWQQINQELEHRVQERTAELSDALQHLQQTQQQLQEREERYRSLVVATAQAVWIADAQGNIRETTAGWQMLTGQTSTAVQHDGWLAAIHPQDRERVKQVWMTAIAHPDQQYQVDYRLISGDGSERDIFARGVAVIGADGQVREWIGTCTDITDRKRIERSLRQSETRYRQLVENSPNPIFSVNRQGLIQSWNRACVEVYQYGNEIIGQPFTRLLANAQVQAIAQTLREEAFAGKVLNGVELVYCAQDQTQRFMMSRLYPIFDDTGAIEGCVFSNTDISDRKRTEETLQRLNQDLEGRVLQRTAELAKTVAQLQYEIQHRQQSEQALRQAYQRLSFHVENSPLAVIEWDTEFKIQRWSTQAESIFGWSFQETSGLTWEDWDFVLESDREMVRQAGIRLVTGVESCNHLQNRNYTKDGSVIYCEWYNSVLLDDAGNLVSILSLVLDITERKRVEEALRTSKERLSLALRAAKAGLWTWDLATNQSFWSSENFKVLGLSPGSCEPNYENWLKSIHPDDREMADTHVKQVLANRTDLNFEFRVLPADGKERWIIDFGKILYDNQNQPTGMIGIQIDITARKQAEEQLKTSLEEKELLLKEVHHRVKNNLQVISSIFSLQSQYIDDPNVLSVLTESQDRIYSMALIHEKLYQSSSLANIDFTDYIQSLIHNLFVSYNVSPNLVRLNLHITNVAMDIDTAIRCGLLINELVANSLKHGFPGHRQGEIQISFLPQPDGQFTLTVQDTGIGLPDTFALEKTNSLGLRLVRTLVRKMKGKLKVWTDQGAIFQITFAQTDNVIRQAKAMHG